MEPTPPPGLDLAASIDINERSHPFDGVETLENDGTAVFTPQSVEILSRELGYDCPRLAVDEAAARGLELSRRFHEYADRHGVDLENLP